MVWKKPFFKRVSSKKPSFVLQLFTWRSIIMNTQYPHNEYIMRTQTVVNGQLSMASSRQPMISDQLSVASQLVAGDLNRRLRPLKRFPLRSK